MGSKVFTDMLFHVPFPQTVYIVVHISSLKQDEEIISEILPGIYGEFLNYTKIISQGQSHTQNHLQC